MNDYILYTCTRFNICTNPCTNFQVSTYTRATYIFKGTHKYRTYTCVYLFLNYVEVNRKADWPSVSFSPLSLEEEARMMFPSWTTLWEGDRLITEWVMKYDSILLRLSLGPDTTVFRSMEKSTHWSSLIHRRWAVESHCNQLWGAGS